MQGKKIMVIGLIASTAVGIGFFSTLEFFAFYSCEKLTSYMLGDLTGVTPHDELTEGQHIQLHKLYDVKQC